jgi:hypothetical protein
MSVGKVFFTKRRGTRNRCFVAISYVTTNILGMSDNGIDLSISSFTPIYFWGRSNGTANSLNSHLL